MNRILRLAPEWEAHEACWMAWPHLPEEWGEHYEQARAELLALARKIANSGGETLRLLVHDKHDLGLVRERAAAEVESGRLIAELGEYGDAWTRDTLPFFLEDEAGSAGAESSAAVFRFDGWGGKYLMPGDATLGNEVASRLGLETRQHEIVVEGGALEVNGAGVGLTTEDSLLVRNQPRDWADTERIVCEALGLSRLLTLRGALLNDHTDGHIDTLARFAPANAVVVAQATDGDPNAEMLMKIHVQCEYLILAHGMDMALHTIPSPGIVLDDQGAPLPASYLNFYIANRAVFVPAYDMRADEDARKALEPLFRGREVISVPARHILTGGGAVHCVTHQQPPLRSHA